MQSQKPQYDLCSFSKQTIQYHNNLSLCPTSNSEEAEVEQFYEKLKVVLEWTLLKIVLLIIRGLECKSKKSRNTCSNKQIWPWSTEWSRAKANWVLPRERTGHSKHPLPTTQEKALHINITRRPTPKSGWLYSLQPKMEKLCTVSKKKDQEWTVAQITNSSLPKSDLNWRK